MHEFMDSNQSTLEEYSKPIVAVTMANGRQGRSVVRHLSKNESFKVRAIVRDVNSKYIEELKRLKSVEIVRCDLLDEKGLQQCFKGVYGVFGNTTPTRGWKLMRGSMVRDYEIEQGKSLVNAVSNSLNEGSLKHFIFSSVCRAKNPLLNEPSPGHFSSKWNIEEYIENSGLIEHSTIIRPVSYFENFNIGLPGINLSDSIFTGIVSGDKVWQTIAVDDIGLWSSAIFKNKNRFINKSLNLAGEELTANTMAREIEKANGKGSEKVRYRKIPRVILSLIEHDLAKMGSWIERTGYGADMESLKSTAREIGIEMTTFSKWLQKNNFYKKPNRLPFIMNLFNLQAS